MNIRRRIFLLGAAAVDAVVFAQAARKDVPTSFSNLVFAFDDEWLPLRDNLKVTLQHPQRYSGNPVLGRGNASDSETYIWYSHWDLDKQYKLIGRRRLESDTRSAISRDIHISQPSTVSMNADGVAQVTPLIVDLLNASDKSISGYHASIAKSELQGSIKRQQERRLPRDKAFRIRGSWPHGEANLHLYALNVERNQTS